MSSPPTTTQTAHLKRIIAHALSASGINGEPGRTIRQEILDRFATATHLRANEDTARQRIAAIGGRVFAEELFAQLQNTNGAGTASVPQERRRYRPRHRKAHSIPPDAGSLEQSIHAVIQRCGENISVEEVVHLIRACDGPHALMTSPAARKRFCQELNKRAETRRFGHRVYNAIGSVVS